MGKTGWDREKLTCFVDAAEFLAGGSGTGMALQICLKLREEGGAFIFVISPSLATGQPLGGSSLELRAIAQW